MLRQIQQKLQSRRFLRQVIKDYSQILQAPPENIGPLSVWGRRARVGDEYSVHIILIRDVSTNLGETQAGVGSMAYMRQFMRSVMAEARASGATSLRIYGHLVENPAFTNERLPAAFGFPRGLINISQVPKIVATNPASL